MAWLHILSLLLIVMTVISYVPQYHRLFVLRSSAGISIGSILMTTLVAQVQSATMYYLFSLAPDMEYGVPIATPRSTRDWLNVAQILTQWICSLVLFAAVIYLPAVTTPDPGVFSKKLVAVSILILHVLLFLFSIIAAGGRLDLPWYIVCNINARIINSIFTLTAIAAFFFQARAMSTAEQPNSCSKWTLGLQSVTFLLVAISWPFRLIVSPNMWELGDQPVILLEWYPWVGWACVNNAIMAIGQGILLFLSFSRVADSKITADGERRPLLGSDEL